MNNRRYFELGTVVVLSVLIAFGLSQFFPSAEAVEKASTLEQIKQRGVLRAGVPIGGLPVGTRDESGQIIGFLPDVGAEMAKALDVKLEIVDTSDANRIPYLQTGKIDFAIGTITLPRNEVVSFSRPIDLGAQAGLVTNSSGITNYDDIATKRIVVVTGATGDLIATKMYPNATITRVDTTSTAIQALQSGQADIHIGDWSTFFLAQKTDASLTILPVIRYEAVGLMLPKADYEWKEWVDYFLNDYYATGTTTCGCGADIFRKWMQYEPNPELFRWY